MTDLAIVIIGRNEGGRLIRCFDALPKGVPAVYVDSGSTDDSMAVATARGLITVALDRSRPFSAARARNAGFAALVSKKISARYIQFLDGDCALAPDWTAAGIAALDADKTVALVTGWRREIDPTASIYNAISDTEWHRPAGDIVACSGDLMVRGQVFGDIGGFDATVIAAEDDEFCLRIGKAGWRLIRLPRAMSLHDANMHHFAEWWRRAVRSGHGFAQVGHMHPPYFRRERLRVAFYGAALPVLAVVLVLAKSPLIVLILLIYLGSFLRAASGLRRAGMPAKMAAHQAVFLTLSKLPNAIGMARYLGRRLARRDIEIIEYK